MYLSVWTQPDLSERYSWLGQHAHNPSSKHLNYLRRVFAYVRGTTNLALHFQMIPSHTNIGVHSLEFAGFTDAAYVDNPNDLKSTFGYIFKFSRGPISSRSEEFFSPQPPAPSQNTSGTLWPSRRPFGSYNFFLTSDTTPPMHRLSPSMETTNLPSVCQETPKFS